MSALFPGLLLFAAEEQEHGLSQYAVDIARPLGFPITNSMVVTWIVAVGLIVFARLATRNMKQVPDGAQNFLEWLVASLYEFLEGVIGPHLVKRTFWFFATIFIFILAANWFGLIPGVGTIGWGHQTPHGFRVTEPLLRGANADLNLTLAMALVFFGCWIVWAFRELGPGGFVKELFAPKGDTTGALKVLMVVVFFAAGLPGDHFDSVPAGLSELSSLRQHLRRRKHAGDHVEAGSRPRLAAAGSVLFPGAAGRLGAGIGVHAADRRLHAADLPARGRITGSR